MKMRRLTLATLICVLFHSAALNVASASFAIISSEAAWQAASSPTQLENFESFQAGTQITSLPNLGVSFDVLAGGGHPQAYSFGGTPHGPMQLGNFPNGIDVTNRWDDIVLRVLPGKKITALGFWNGDGQNATLVARAYDASDNLLGSVGALKGTFAGFTSDVAVSRVVFDGNTGDGWNHLDGLQTDVSSVPEPTSLALWTGLGLMGLIAVRRRRELA